MPNAAPIPEKVHVPVVAIGGIKAENAAQIAAAGAGGIAAISAIVCAEDSAAAAKKTIAAFVDLSRMVKEI